MDNGASDPRAGKRPWYQPIDPLQRGPVPEVPHHRTQCPEYQTSLFGRLTFGWMTPIIAAGYRRPLEKTDLWLVNPERSIKILKMRFDGAFRERVRQKSKHPLAAALHDTFKREFWIGGSWLFVACICQTLIPFVLRFLLAFVEEAYNGSGQSVGVGLGLVFGIVGMQIIQSVGTNQFIYAGFMVGAQARAVLVATLFDKSLKLSERARIGGPRLLAASCSETDTTTKQRKKKKKMKTSSEEDSEGYSAGRITTLMSADAGRVDMAAGMFHFLWSAPLQILLSFALLLVNITYSAVAGFGLLFFGIAGLTFGLKSLLARRKTINPVTDARISLTHEVLGSVRFIKYNACEEPFLNKLARLRGEEVIGVTKLNAMRNALNSVSIALPIFGAMLSFIVYSKTGHRLAVAPVFSSLALFTALRVPFNMLPLVIGQLADAWTAVGRLQDFFMAEEYKEEIRWDETADEAISLEDASFVWEKSPNAYADPEKQTRPFSLDNINLSIKRGELLAVVGSVGSGKSSLLSALAGEMRKIDGHLTLGASSRAYCPQRAWIQHATLKANVIFGQPLDPMMYEQAIQACSLGIDIDALPAGEQTEIGERGVNLSGGQQQRVNLARAIYSDSDIILMDDPLSAVDAHVGKHIFKHAICDMLRHKTRILSTHQLHVLSRCDRVLWLEDGRIKLLGTYADLLATEPEFRDLVARAQQDENSDETQAPKELPVRDSIKPSALSPGSLVQDEERAVGSLSWTMIKTYLRSSGSLIYGIAPILFLILAQSSNALTSIWVAFWSSNRLNLAENTYIALYVVIGFLQAILLFSFGASVSVLSGRATRKMVDHATARVVQAPLSFHDTQPRGRILNRLSRDVEVMDNQLPDSVRTFMYSIAIVTSIVVMLGIFVHWFLVAVPVLIGIFLYAMAYYRASAIQLKRYEATLRGVMFARFSESITGIPTIRAYGVQDQARKTVHDAIDDMDSAYLLTLSNQRWVTCRLDCVAILAVMTVGLIVVLLRFTVHPSESGLVLSYSLAITQVMQLVARQMSEVENAMISTERLHEYGTELPQESSPQAPGILPVPETWPTKGKINMINVQLRYRPGLPLVLHGLNMSIHGGEKIAIVGRTGAGKSSISTALFRLVELSAGSISIDGINIAQVPLHDLRSRISIVQQDPNLFRGTVRSNLDPFNQYGDPELWDVLRRVGLGDKDADNLAAGRVTLDSPVEEHGTNFSQGQRQLISIARALLRNNRIILCDEATSSVDLETDARIQRAIMEVFAGRTVLTIAHRLKTIVGYDRVCVLEQGQIVEFDSPLTLWEQEDSAFRGLCDRGGVESGDFFADRLDRLARGEGRRHSQYGS
ncbi:uncharacterized protein NECHADRAFT_73313 [Fusarium vanettenii 77-13-4]|uniref:ABC transporter n=1 Tax=Fusarium vanettenii (strain ATCC MYA-4622 / CBS 123669 / FGSC 9596 / NRRL 45880 / 77-13-4) TaxID=660122 RepID=C7ZRF9_FUSV7|nr:uncharacterized protein NECHADRAFT_73313 [Fusarium vanettenii 77-13-4]EEU33400.1 hypothetical protein NECHADRAFT_73313 [Fusarium vanettenii 77-13-4]